MSFAYVCQESVNAYALISSAFNWGLYGLDVDGWFLLVLMTISRVVWVCKFVWAGEIFCLLSAI